MAYIPNTGSTVAFQGTVPWSVLGATTNVGSIITVSQGSVISVNQGSIATVIIGGSIAANFTPPANQSISGTVGASIIGLPPVNVTNFPTNQNISGSVVAFQGAAPWANTNVGSVITVGQGSIAVNIIAGSIAVSVTPPANQSVSGTVQTDVRGSVATVIIGGSIAATFVPPANQSVSGTVQADIRGSVATVIIGGSIAASFTPPANQSVSGTVGASIIGQLPAGTAVLGSIAVLQGTDPWTVKSSLAGGIFPVSGSVAATITNTNVNVSGSVAAWLQSTNASVITVGTAAPNQSVSGTVGASLIGLSPVSVSNFPTTQNVSGSVVAFQGTTPWQVVSSLAGGIFPISGSVAAVVTNFPTTQNVSGSVVATQGTSPWNIAGSVASWLQSSNASVITVGTAAPNQSVSGTVGASLIGLSPVSVSNFPTTQNVSGSVVSFPAGTIITSLVSTVPSSVIVGTSIFGQLPGGTAVLGSVAALQGTNPWIVTSSIAGGIFPISGSVSAVITNANVNVSGSVVAFQAGTQVTSLVSTVPSSVIVGSSIFGQLPAGTAMLGSVVAYQGVIPWTTNIQSSVAVAIISGSVAVATGNSSVQVLNFPANQSVSGKVMVQGSTSIGGGLTGGAAGADFPVQVGGIARSVAIAVGDSSITGAWFGQSGALQIGIFSGAGNAGSDNGNQGATIVASGGTSSQPIGTAGYIFNGANWDRQRGNSSVGTIVNTGTSSVITTNVGSIITVFQAASIVGTYAEDTAHTTGDKGLMHLGVRNDTGSVLTNADVEYVPFTTDSSGQIRVTNGNSWIPSTYAVLSSLTTISIMNANQSRKGATIYNNAGTNLFVKLGTAANTSVFTVAMSPGAYYEVPFGYVGVVAGITASNAGIINVTEIT